jgi:rare lipoprotein A
LAKEAKTMARIHVFGLCFYSLALLGIPASIATTGRVPAKEQRPSAHVQPRLEVSTAVEPNPFAVEDATPKVLRTVQFGLASWYGPHFQGRRTASGRRFDMRKLTAAHRSLPLGSKVRVTNLENGRSVEVTIDDRGPYVRRRLIDLSKAAARKLGITRKEGLALVRLDLVRTAVAFN